MYPSYKETLTYLYDTLPMFQRVGASAYNKDLANTWKLCEALDNPQNKFKCVHIAGTNGKGSSSHMVASILQSAGYKTGLYTSPHLKNFTERIKVNGAEVAESFVVEFVDHIKSVLEVIRPSFFETTVAMAFQYFAEQQVDIGVIEVGLGGRLDSTNVITPELSLITNIGWDHKDLLGDTLQKIASEKAGIIKPKIPAVISQRQPAIDEVFEEKAKRESAPLYFASDELRAVSHNDADAFVAYDIFKNDQLLFKNLSLPLMGFYQQKNIIGVIKSIEILQRKGWAIPSEKIAHGLANVVVQTGLKGRWQVLNRQPLIVCDTGHNIDGVHEVLKQIEAQSFKKLHIVWGSVRDKDIAEILRLLPKHANYYFCQANIPRALEAKVLAAMASDVGLKGEIIPDVNLALDRAKARAAADDMIFIGGSTFVVAEIDNL